MIAFWIGVLSQSAWLFVAVLLNSVIHTFMYTYFFLKTLYPSMHIPAAKYLTQAQIVQFVVGSILSFPPLLMGDECDTQSSRIALAWMETYVWGLAALSVDRQAYAVLRGSFRDNSITSFLQSLTTGRQVTEKLSSGIPTIATVEPWDGMDGEPFEEELSLAEIMGWDDDEEEGEL